MTRDGEASQTHVDQDEVHLRIGGQDFHTTRATLTSECELFQTIFGGDVAPPGDGVYKLDRDPKCFELILSFCRTKTFPLLRTSTGDLDHGFYVTLEREAGFYVCHKLEKWLMEQTYLKVLSFKIETEYIPIHSYFDGYVPSITHRQGDVKPGEDYYDGSKVVTTSYLTYRRKKYRCPRQIYSHLTADHCGARCRRAQEGHDEDQYVTREDKYLARIIRSPLIRRDLLIAK